jgi:hypothetical protein
VRRIHSLLITGLCLALLAPPAHAQTPTCDRLAGSKEALAAELLASQRPYDCCSDTIANCLEQQPTCLLALRLAENICGRVANGQPKKRIVDALWDRYRSMKLSGSKARIDLTGLPAAGDANAPITLVEYGCPRCPYCAKSTLEMHDAVMKGPLKGKVKLYFRTFPIRGHEHTRESGLAFLAAVKLGRFWEFALHFYQRFDQFSVRKQLEWAEAVGMDRHTFEQAMADPAARQALIDVRKEGIINNVMATPTFFINGRRYRGEVGLAELVDVLEEEYDRIKEIRHRQ